MCCEADRWCRYAAIKHDILGSEDEEEAAAEGGGEEGGEEEGQAYQEVHTQQIEDATEADKINLRRTIYLTIMSRSLPNPCTPSN